MEDLEIIQLLHFRVPFSILLSYFCIKKIYFPWMYEDTKMDDKSMYIHRITKVIISLQKIKITDGKFRALKVVTQSKFSICPQTFKTSE